MDRPLYSLRMRAECGGGHSSGGERVVTTGELPAATAALVARALAAGTLPDAVHCTIEVLHGALPRRALPAVRTLTVPDWQTGRACAQVLLQRAGVAPSAAAAGIALLASGPAPGGRVMRGALLLDAVSGARLEADPERGVRVSRMDLVPDARSVILAGLAAAGLDHHRVVEALVLAGKVLHAPGLVAELCWSDDPDYLAGYVAAPDSGYQRITLLKAAGDPLGGRVLFVHAAGWDREACCAYLERQAVLFDALGPVDPPRPWRP